MIYHPEYKFRGFEETEAEKTEKAHKKAREILDKEAVKPDEFEGEEGYDATEIRKDKFRVNELKEIFQKTETPEEKEEHKLATILEAIIYLNAELGDWFGPEAFTVKTSDFDDFENGVDMVIESIDENESATHLALAVDVTFSLDTRKKFDRIRNEIEKGKLANVKYFVSENSPHRQLENIPRVVIGVSADTVKKLSDAWLNQENQKIANHPIQLQILEEIMVQLETFENYAASIGKKEIADIYQKEKMLIEEIYNSKKELIKGGEYRDKVFYKMTENVKSRFISPSTAGIR